MPLQQQVQKLGITIHYTGDPSVGIMAETYFAEAPFDYDADQEMRNAFQEMISYTYSQFCAFGKMQLCWSDQDPDDEMCEDW